MQAMLDDLRNRVGGDNLSVDALEREYFSQDVYSRGRAALAVVSPANREELAAVVKTVAGAGASVVSRGGGMSYTGGYVPAEDNAVIVDTSRMNRVLELNREDMYVTVEAGITWAALHEALKGSGLRTPFWGTLSGLYATVGGSLSQNSIFFGSARYGSAADSVLCMEVALADGSLLNTGSAAQVNAPPFFRHFGPDLTGLFTADCGALGIKATVTLRLIPEPRAHGFASFAFEAYPETMAAMSDIARADAVTECFGFDPYLQQQRMKRESLASDVKKLGGVLKAAGGVGKALRDGARMAVAGRHFMHDVRWSFHVMTEARTQASATAALEEVRDIVRKHGGRELPDSIPKLVHANPFGPVNNMLGPEGERWAPVHGLLPHSRAVEAMARIEALFAQRRERLDALDIHTGYLLATVSTNGFVIEPVFFWPDAIMEIHRRSVQPEHLRRLRTFPENREAREAVAELRTELVALFSELGAVHLQIGKSYRYRQGLEADAFALVQGLKKLVDPGNRINPGNLGL